MSEGELIDKAYDTMYTEAMDSKYGFVRFAVPWGNRYSAEYNRKKVDFSRTLREFSRHCGVLSLSGEFYVFGGRVWEPISSAALEQAYNRLLESLGIAEVMNNSVVRREVFLGTILAYNHLHPRNDLVAFSNCVVDMRDGRKPVQHKFSPDYHVLDYHPYIFSPQAKGKLWGAFLRQVLPRKRDRDVLQMFLGLGLIQMSDAFGEGKEKEKSGTVELCLLLLGSGANGKSVLFNVICALFGKRHVTSLDYDVLTADGDEGLRGRYPIRSAVFNWSSDSDPRRFGKKNTAVFKQIVSGEPVAVRGIRRDIEFLEHCPYLIFSLNELPSIADQSYGFLRRLQFVNFDVTIPRHRQDPNLAYRIIQEDLPGVFNWVLRGAMEIKRRKFQFPQTETTRKQLVRSLLGTYPVRSWTLAYELRSEGTTKAELSEAVYFSVLYDSFVRFCSDNGVQQGDILSDRRFSAQLIGLGFVRRRMADGMTYICYGCGKEGLQKGIFIESISEPDDYVDEDSIIKED